MFAYIAQAYTCVKDTELCSYLASTIKFLNDSKDPFEAGDLIEIQETMEHIEVEAPQLPAESSSNSSISPRKPRVKVIESDKYSKQKGEKVSEWRKCIIP